MKRHRESILIVDASEAKGEIEENVEGLGDHTSRVFLRLQVGLLHWLHLLLLGFGLKIKVVKQSQILMNAGVGSKRCRHPCPHTHILTIKPRMEGRDTTTHNSQFHTAQPGHETQYLLIFGSLRQVKSGVDFRGTLLTEGGQLKGHRLSQAVTRLQLELRRLCGNLVEVSAQNVPKVTERGETSASPQMS